jgi:sugar porter (SP) family MFS transporter
MGTPDNHSSIQEPVPLDQLESNKVDLDIKSYKNAADEATNLEHNLSVKEAFQMYPMAATLSVLFCVCIIMDGYDSDLITNLYGLPSFKRKYGVLFKGEYYVSAPWQTAFAMSSPVGRVLGGAIQGYVAEAYGRKKTLIGCLFIVTGFIFMTFFASTNIVLLVGEMLCGIVWGILSSLAPTYASEVCPLRLRDILTAYVNLCWSTGQLIATGVLAGYASNNTEWAYRIPFGLQWIWPVLILTFSFWAPESPYWLVRHGKIDQAEAALQRLTRSDKVDIQQSLALIQRTNEREREHQTQMSYLDCFRGTNLWRTEISAMAWAIQILSGLSLPFYAVVFFEQAGFPTTQAFNMNVGMTALGFVATLCVLLPNPALRPPDFVLWRVVLPHRTDAAHWLPRHCARPLFHRQRRGSSADCLVLCVFPDRWPSCLCDFYRDLIDSAAWAYRGHRPHGVVSPRHRLQRGIALPSQREQGKPGRKDGVGLREHLSLVLLLVLLPPSRVQGSDF